MADAGTGGAARDSATGDEAGDPAGVGATRDGATGDSGGSPKRVFTEVAELEAAVGEYLGHSDWVLIDQARIDAFAEATGDRQWIHVDPDRAASGPFGSTVAHGYLTLSLLPVLVSSLVEYAGWPVKINYGSNKVRFPQPVPVDSSVRAGVEVDAVTAVPSGTQVALRVSVEIRTPDGQILPKPALVAETLTLLAP